MGMSLPVLGVPGLLGANLYYTTNTINISPTLGPELLTNGNFSAWTADNPDGWSVVGESASDPEVSEVGTGEGHGGAGTGACNLYSSAITTFRIHQNVLAVDAWLAAAITIDTVISGQVQVRDAGAGLYAAYGTTGTKTLTGRVASTYFQVRVGTVPCDITIDDASAKTITTHTQTFVHSQWIGDFTINYSRTANYQAGVYALYSDTDNYVLAYDCGNGNVYLIKTVAGTVTQLGSWSHTYAADKDLTLRVHKDGTMDVLYDGTTLVSGLADTGLRGKQGGALLTDSSEVTINSYTWDARSAT